MPSPHIQDCRHGTNRADPTAHYPPKHSWPFEPPPCMKKTRRSLDDRLRKAADCLSRGVLDRTQCRYLWKAQSRSKSKPFIRRRAWSGLRARWRRVSAVFRNRLSGRRRPPYFRTKGLCYRLHHLSPGPRRGAVGRRIRWRDHHPGSGTRLSAGSILASGIARAGSHRKRRHADGVQKAAIGGRATSESSKTS